MAKIFFNVLNGEVALKTGATTVRRYAMEDAAAVRTVGTSAQKGANVELRVPRSADVMNHCVRRRLCLRRIMYAG
jgi:hypothetical protein